MDVSIFKEIDAVVKAAKTTNGHELAQYLKIEEYTHSGPFVGYAVKVGRYKTISVHEDLSRRGNLLVTDHEIGHIVRDHFEFVNGIGTVRDREVFSPNQRLLPELETEANLIGIDLYISTERILHLVGYNNPSVVMYRSISEQMRKLLNQFNDLADQARFCENEKDRRRSRDRGQEIRRLLHALDEQRVEYGNDIQTAHCCFTLDGLAREFHVSSSLIQYKLQALSLRGYDIDTQDLESFSKLFKTP